MVTLFVAVLMEKILSPSALLTRVAIAWIRTGRRQAATIPAGRGVPHPCLQRLHPLATPWVVMLFPPALERTLTLSQQSSGHARRPYRTRGNSVVFAGSSGGAGEEAGGASALVLRK